MDARKRQKILHQFGKKVKEIRESRGLSIRGLADLADVDYSNLDRIENGITEAKISTIFAIAGALDLEPAELLK